MTATTTSKKHSPATKTTSKASAAAKETKRKSRKRARSAPTKVKAAFNFYYTAKWRELEESSTERKGLGEMSKLISVSWNQMSDEEKRPFVEKHEADKARVAQLRIDQPELFPVVQKRAKKSHKKNPANVGSAYFIFLKDAQQTIPKGTPNQPALISKMWKELPDDRRKHYYDLLELKKQASIQKAREEEEAAMAAQTAEA